MDGLAQFCSRRLQNLLFCRSGIFIRNKPVNPYPMFAFHPQCPMLTPPITILSYTAESDVIYAPNNQAESRHRKIWQYFVNGDALKSRRKAFSRIQKEKDRFDTITVDAADDGSPYAGLILYFDYRLNTFGKGKKDKVHRFYLLDGEAISQTELLERMQQETLFLLDAGLVFRQVEIEDERGRLFWVAEDGLLFS